MRLPHVEHGGTTIARGDGVWWCSPWGETSELGLSFFGLSACLPK